MEEGESGGATDCETAEEDPAPAPESSSGCGGVSSPESSSSGPTSTQLPSISVVDDVTSTVNKVRNDQGRTVDNDNIIYCRENRLSHKQQQPRNAKQGGKMRRDKLNSYIGELATLVPMVARSPKRMDKTSILRLTATHLRLHQTLLNGNNRPHMDLPKIVNQLVLERLVFETLGGFLLILTPTGKIVFVSHTVENVLGHQQTDLMGQSIFNITSQDDHERLKMYINKESILDQEWRKYFNLRLKRAGPRTESPVYEPVRIMGVHKSGNTGMDSSNSAQSTTNTGSRSTSPCSSSGGGGNNANQGMPSPSSSAPTSYNNDVLIFFVRVFRPEPLKQQLIEATKDEYMTRHLIDGRIINCDQRISLIAGYMTEEVSGMSAFKFMHREDVRWVMIALRQMYDRGESKGSSCYRLLSRNGQFIYLRTFGFLEIDDQGTVESFVCINTLVTEREGLQLINEMKKKFSAIINSETSPITSVESTDSSVQSVEDPQKVEAAIVHLITNLPSPGPGLGTPDPHHQQPQQQQHSDRNDPEAKSSRSTPSPRTYTATTTSNNNNNHKIHNNNSSNSDPDSDANSLHENKNYEENQDCHDAPATSPTSTTMLLATEEKYCPPPPPPPPLPSPRLILLDDHHHQQQQHNGYSCHGNRQQIDSCQASITTSYHHHHHVRIVTRTNKTARSNRNNHHHNGSESSSGDLSAGARAYNKRPSNSPSADRFPLEEDEQEQQDVTSENRRGGCGKRTNTSGGSNGIRQGNVCKRQRVSEMSDVLVCSPSSSTGGDCASTTTSDYFVEEPEPSFQEELFFMEHHHQQRDDDDLDLGLGSPPPLLPVPPLAMLSPQSTTATAVDTRTESSSTSILQELSPYQKRPQITEIMIPHQEHLQLPPDQPQQSMAYHDHVLRHSV